MANVGDYLEKDLMAIKIPTYQLTIWLMWEFQWFYFFSSTSCEDWHRNLKKSVQLVIVRLGTKYLFHGNVSSIFNEKKLTKIEGKFENEKKLQKKKIFAFVESWTQDLS